MKNEKFAKIFKKSSFEVVEQIGNFNEFSQNYKYFEKEFQESIKSSRFIHRIILKS